VADVRRRRSLRTCYSFAIQAKANDDSVLDAQQVLDPRQHPRGDGQQYDLPEELQGSSKKQSRQQ